MKPFTTAAAICFVPFLFCFPTVNSQAPPNDECINATVIPSVIPSYPYFSNTTNYFRATVNPNDPKPPCFVDFDESNPDYTVWYSWTPSEAGVFTFNTFDSVLDPAFPRDEFTSVFPGNFMAIFKGSTCASLELIACSEIYLTNIALQANQTYLFLVSQTDSRASYQTVPGYLVLSVNPTPPAPSNDECTTAVEIPPEFPLPFTAFAVDVDRATQNNATDKTCQLEKGDSVWARWSPATSGTYMLDTGNSRSLYNGSYYMQIGVYTGASCETATQVACDDFTIDSLSVRAGKTYFIKVQVEDLKDINGGKVQLDIKQGVARPGFFLRLWLCLLALLFGQS